MISFQRLKDIREDNDMSQSRLANKLGVTRSAYSLWELGINIIPLNYLCDFLCDFFCDFSRIKLSELKPRIMTKTAGRKVSPKAKGIPWPNRLEIKRF